MKILLLGKNGQVGWELQRSLTPLGSVTALDRASRDGLCGDLLDTNALSRTVRTLRPDVIVNAAAYTAVDKAEAEVEVARRINTEAPGVLAREAASLDALLVHYSTDYVFDGSGKRPWREDDEKGPVNIYGETKLAGEREIEATGCNYLIFRTSWVYAARGHNFIHTMLRLASERDTLRVVNDQVGAPTGAELIADVTAYAIVRAHQDAAFRGVYHLAAAGETSWHAYARHVIGHAAEQGWKLRVRPADIEGIATESFPTPARRPCNSRLDCRRLTEKFGIRLPEWQMGVERVLAELPVPNVDKGVNE